MAAENDRLRADTEFLRAKLSAADAVVFHGDREARLAGILNFGILGMEQDTLLIRLDLEGFAVSAGSACSAGAARPSHVLQAMGVLEAEARASIRVSLGRFTKREEIVSFADLILEIAAEKC